MIVWQLENNIITDRAKREKAHDRDILCVAWNRDSTQLATASGDNTVKVWNNKCELLQTLRGHEQAVCCVVWNP
jgi:WD40 repeat protein